MEQRPGETRPQVVCGRNAVEEALASGRADQLLLAREENSPALRRLAALAAAAGVPVKEVTRQKLASLCGEANHQGVALTLAAAPYATLDDLLAAAKQRGEAPFLVLCDSLEDPHNLGAILRTAECVGVHGVVLPKRRSVSLTPAVAKAASGALLHMPVARVANLAEAVTRLQQAGVWVYGAHMEGEDYRTVDYTGGCALVIGGEGGGLSRLLRQKCDKLVRLPMCGHVNSLNASVAAGVLLYRMAEGRPGMEGGGKA